MPSIDYKKKLMAADILDDIVTIAHQMAEDIRSDAVVRGLPVEDDLSYSRLYYLRSVLNKAIRLVGSGRPQMLSAVQQRYLRLLVDRPGYLLVTSDEEGVD